MRNLSFFSPVDAEEEQSTSGGVKLGLISGAAVLAGAAAGQGGPDGFSPGGSAIRSALAAGVTVTVLTAVFGLPAVVAAVGVSTASLSDA